MHSGAELPPATKREDLGRKAVGGASGPEVVSPGGLASLGSRAPSYKQKINTLGKLLLDRLLAPSGCAWRIGLVREQSSLLQGGMEVLEEIMSLAPRFSAGHP